MEMRSVQRLEEHAHGTAVISTGKGQQTLDGGCVSQICVWLSVTVYNTL